MRKWLGRALAAVCCLCLLTGPAGAEDVQERIDALCDQYDAIGLSAAYVSGGQVRAVYASGWATVNDAPMTADTKVRIASVTKVLVGLAAHLTAEAGYIDLDAPIDDAIGFYLARRSQADVISPRSILTHTSSLKTALGPSGVYDAVHETLSDPDSFYPAVSGSLRNWDYNNYAFYVLGLAIEHASGQTLDQILNAGLLNALEADGSFWAGDLKRPELTATVYTQEHGIGLSFEEQVAVHSKGPAANGAVFAGNYHISARDLGKIAATLAADGVYAGERVLPTSVVEALEEIRFDRPVPDSRFYQAQPLRYQENMLGREALYYHTGSSYGELCFFSYDPARGDGVVVLSTGAERLNYHGIYGVCGEIAELLYALCPEEETP